MENHGCCFTSGAGKLERKKNQAFYGGEHTMQNDVI